MIGKIEKAVALAVIMGGIMYFIVGHAGLIVRNILSFICTTGESPWAIVSIGLMLLGIFGLPIIYVIKRVQLYRDEAEAEKNIKIKEERCRRLDEYLQRERNVFVEWQNKEMTRIFGVSTKEEVEKLPSKTEKVNEESKKRGT